MQYNKQQILKKNFLKLMIVGGILLTGSITARAQIVVVRPHAYIEVGARPSRPTPRHYWRDEDWEWRGGAYQRVPGGWEERDRPGRWHKGYWGREKGGERWHGGHWGGGHGHGGHR